jgi:2-polyprenyl-6-hydroxyphenyl methylase/3-demethylubiquinone-9 3-methyltransferase
MPTATTADADEIARFTSIADSWWDTNGKFKPLHQLNPARLTFIRDHLCQHFDRDPMAPTPLDGLKILDVGCGGGLLSEPMRRLGGIITGIDAGAKNIEVATLHAKQFGLDIDYRHILPENIDADLNDLFDVVLNMEIVEHVADLDLFLRSSSVLVRPSGVMVLSTINRTLKSLALAKIGAEYILRWLPQGTHDWRKFVRPSELARGLRPHGIKIKNLKGISYSLLNDSWSLADNLDVNYLVWATRSPE